MIFLFYVNIYCTVLYCCLFSRSRYNSLHTYFEKNPKSVEVYGPSGLYNDMVDVQKKYRGCLKIVHFRFFKNNLYHFYYKNSPDVFKTVYQLQ